MLAAPTRPLCSVAQASRCSHVQLRYIYFGRQKGHCWFCGQGGTNHRRKRMRNVHLKEIIQGCLQRKELEVSLHKSVLCAGQTQTRMHVMYALKKATAVVVEDI